MLLNKGTLTSLSTFSEYVRPQEQKYLSEFCTELTGIHQYDVDSARTLDEVLHAVGRWLDRNIRGQAYDSILPVTCGDWDLKTMLPTEAWRKRLTYHPSLHWWCNVKPVFRLRTQLQGRCDLMEMIQHLQIEHTGRHHSGIDDVRNLVAIIHEREFARGLTPPL